MMMDCDDDYDGDGWRCCGQSIVDSDDVVEEEELMMIKILVRQEWVKDDEKCFLTVLIILTTSTMDILWNICAHQAVQRIM